MTKTTQNQFPEIAPETGIEQLNLSYHVEQDRLLFRVGLSNKSEVIVWLTQRIARQMLAMLRGESGLPALPDVESAMPTEAVKQFKQEAETFEKLQKLDFNTEYQHQQKAAADHSLLAISLNLQGQSTKSLEFACLGGVTVNMKLTEDLILALTNMLMLSAKEAQWQLSQTKAGGDVISVAKSALLH